jgi:hypothetical protein
MALRNKQNERKGNFRDVGNLRECSVPVVGREVAVHLLGGCTLHSISTMAMRLLVSTVAVFGSIGLAGGIFASSIFLSVDALKAIVANAKDDQEKYEATKKDIVLHAKVVPGFVACTTVSMASLGLGLFVVSECAEVASKSVS